MKKVSVLKKALASVVSAATLISCTAANTMNFAAVTAADGANYAEALAMSLYFFDANECGTEVDDNCLTWRGNCHTYDAEASLDSAVNLSSSEKEMIRAANGGSNTVDASGGYHDAGDHIKFNVTMGFAASSLAMSYYMNPGAYEKANCEGHFKEILKKTCDYLMKTTYLDSSGNVYAVCATVANSADHDVTWEAPEKQTYDRPTYWLTKSFNNSVTTATMASALAGTAYVFKDVDSEYSAECMKYAKALYNFAKDYPGMNDTNSGLYSLTDTYVDDLALTEVWFYINGEGSLPTYKPTANGCYNGQYYDYHLYCWDKVWSGYATLMYYITGDQTFASEMQFELNNKGGLSTTSYNAAGWGASRYNCALQMVALGLAKGDANSSYALGAKYQTDYLLGNNQKSTSFLLGYGNKWPDQIHHRAANPGKTSGMSSGGHILYGALVGGPTDSNCTYTDQWDQYQSTEPALDYNACFALACAGLVNLYGGDASELDDIIKNADEIDETYDFGSGENPQPTTEATEATETTGGNEKLKGDVNNDGAVDISDVVCLGRYLVGDSEQIEAYTTSGEYVWTNRIGENSYSEVYLDVNEDEKVNVFDYVSLRKILINK